MRVKQFQKKDEDLEEIALHLRRMKEQNKKLFHNKYQLRKIFLNADDLMLKHDTKLDNRHDFKFVFR